MQQAPSQHVPWFTYKTHGLQERDCASVQPVFDPVCCLALLYRHPHTLICSLQGLYYLLGTAPNPVLGALDFYVATPISNLFKKNYDAPDFALREK
jgi:hypothetical protein